MSRVVLAIAVLLGLGGVANGLFMLVAPVDWYFAVPGVTTTGSYNQHFIRDIGLIFVGAGAAFLLGARQPKHRAVAWGAAAVWLSGHALFHFWEVAVGLCAPSALLRDFPAVTLPALLAVAITIHAFTDKEAAR